MAVFMLTPAVMVVLVVLALTTSGPPEPHVALTPPVGYRAVTDAYYAYAVPASWSQNAAYTDQNGDFFYQGAGGWAAETLQISKVAPGPDERPPSSFKAFGEPEPVPFELSLGAALKVPGSDVAWAHLLTRPGGFRAQALDVWEKSTQTEIWLLVRSNKAITTTIVGSLRGSGG